MLDVEFVRNRVTK